MTSVSAGHIIQTPTQPVGSGRPQRESNPGPPHQESRALPQSYRAPPPPPPPPELREIGILRVGDRDMEKDTDRWGERERERDRETERERERENYTDGMIMSGNRKIKTWESDIDVTLCARKKKFLKIGQVQPGIILGHNALE